MKFDIITIFPESFESYLNTSLLARARAKDFVDINIHNLRDYTDDPHRTVDGRPYGGGAGMVMKVDIIAKALKNIYPRVSKKTRVIALTPSGKLFNQKKAEDLKNNYNRLILLCGRYEGFDDRVLHLVDEELSIGDYILTGGELPAMVVTDTVARLIPGVVGKEESIKKESFSPESNLLEHPHYTRPEIFEWKGKKLRVPKVLLSGNHAEIEKWRKEQAIKKTKKNRPDLISKNDK